MPRNFATLAQLGLLRLFTGLWEKELALPHSYFPALSRRQTLYIDIIVFAVSCVFSKQSLPSIM